jgi:hypothetical protein
MTIKLTGFGNSPIANNAFDTTLARESKRLAIAEACRKHAEAKGKAAKTYPYLFGMVSTGDGETRQYFAVNMTREDFSAYCSDQYKAEQIGDGYGVEEQAYNPEFILTSNSKMTLTGSWFC